MNAKNKTKQADTGCVSPRVCLGLTHATAQEVCIAGSFNDWNPSVTQMTRLSDGKRAKELALAPGRYEYRFVVDGQRVDDPAATELIPNPFGTPNAVLEVRPAAPAPPARSGAAARADIPPKRTTGNLPLPSRATARRGGVALIAVQEARAANPRSHRLNGIVDVTAHSLTVQNSTKAQPLVIQWSERTRFRDGKEPAGPKSLRAGQTMRVTYRVLPERLEASRVDVRRASDVREKGSAKGGASDLMEH